MRIHTSTITYDHIRELLNREQAAGRIARHVTFKTLDRPRSSIRARAFEIQLEAGERDRGRRAGNSGSYGVMRPEYDGFAATFDEWGWLLAALYRMDPAMVVGTPNNPTYVDRADFNERTGFTYSPKLPDLLEDADPFPYTIGHSRIGRRGGNRRRQATYATYATYAPRTPEWARAFNAGEVF